MSAGSCMSHRMFIMNFFFVDNWSACSVGSGWMSGGRGAETTLFTAFVLSVGIDRQTAKLPVCVPTVPG